MIDRSQTGVRSGGIAGHVIHFPKLQNDFIIRALSVPLNRSSMNFRSLAMGVSDCTH